MWYCFWHVFTWLTSLISSADGQRHICGVTIYYYSLTHIDIMTILYLTYCYGKQGVYIIVHVSQANRAHAVLNVCLMPHFHLSILDAWAYYGWRTALWIYVWPSFENNQSDILCMTMTHNVWSMCANLKGQKELCFCSYVVDSDEFCKQFDAAMKKFTSSVNQISIKEIPR